MVQVVDTVLRYTRRGQPSGQDRSCRYRLRSDEAADAIERTRARGHRVESGAAPHAAAEEPNCHVPRVDALANVAERANHIAGFEDPARGDAAVGRTTQAGVAQS